MYFVRFRIALPQAVLFAALGLACVLRAEQPGNGAGEVVDITAPAKPGEKTIAEVIEPDSDPNNPARTRPAARGDRPGRRSPAWLLGALRCVRVGQPSRRQAGIRMAPGGRAGAARAREPAERTQALALPFAAGTVPLCAARAQREGLELAAGDEVHRQAGPARPD